MRIHSGLFVWIGLLAAVDGAASELQLRWQRGAAAPVTIDRVDQQVLDELLDKSPPASAAAQDSEEVHWSLAGDIRAADRLLVWSPYYSIRGRKLAAGETEAAASQGHVSLFLTAQRKDQLSLDRLWPQKNAHNGLLVFAWEVDGKVTQAKVVALWREEAREYLLAAATFLLSREEANGQPVVLLMGETGWLEPRSRFKSGDELAFRAIMQRDRAKLESVWKAGTNPLKRSLSGVSLLTYAAEVGALDCLEYLIANIPAGDRDRIGADEEASRWAAANGRIDAVRLMLAAGLKFAGKGAWGEEPLVRAISGRHREVAALLAPMAAESSVRAMEALLCHIGDVELLNVFLAARAGSSLDERELAAALYSQVRMGNAAMVAWLLDQGARPLAVDDVQGRISLGSVGGRRPTHTVPTPSHTFDGGDFTRRNYAITRRSAGDEPLLNVAVQSGNVETVTQLLEAGIDPNIADAAAATPLILAVRVGDTALVQSLLAAGASPLLRDEGGRCALDYAAERGALEICSLLLAAGADTASLDAEGLTPVMRAWRAGAMEVTRMLLAANPHALRTSRWNRRLVDQAIGADAPDLLAALHERDATALSAAQASDLALFRAASNCLSWLTKQGLATGGAILAKPAELDASIRLKTQVKPTDPRIARIDHARTEFRVSFFVDDEGRPRGVKVGDQVEGALRAATLDAIDQWTFEPARKNGQTVWTQVVMNMAFDENRLAIRARTDVSAVPVYVNNRFDPGLNGRGRLVLEFLVDRFGRASDFVILFAEDLEYAAARCVQIGLAEFRPAESEGVPVPFRMVYSFSE